MDEIMATAQVQPTQPTRNLNTHGHTLSPLKWLCIGESLGILGILGIIGFWWVAPSRNSNCLCQFRWSELRHEFFLWIQRQNSNRHLASEYFDNVLTFSSDRRFVSLRAPPRIRRPILVHPRQPQFPLVPPQLNDRGSHASPRVSSRVVRRNIQITVNCFLEGCTSCRCQYRVSIESHFHRTNAVIRHGRRGYNILLHRGPEPLVQRSLFGASGSSF